MLVVEAPKVFQMTISRLVPVMLGIFCVMQSLPLSAAPTRASSVKAFHESYFSGQTVEQSLIVQLRANYEAARFILASAIASSPGSVRKIIEVAMDEGVLPTDIAAQCEDAITPKQLETLIKTALNESIDPIPVIEQCLVLVKESQVAGLLAIAINNSTPGQIEFIIRAAYDTLSSSYADPLQLVKTSVLQSNAFSVEGLESVEGIDGLLGEIKLQDMLENLVLDEAAGQVEVEQDDFEPEPPFSDS